MLKNLCDAKSTCTAHACDNFWNATLPCKPEDAVMWLSYKCNGVVEKRKSYDKITESSSCKGETPNPITTTITGIIQSTTTYTTISSTSYNIPSCNPKKDSIKEGKLIQRDVVDGHEVTIDCKGGCIEIIKVRSA